MNQRIRYIKAPEPYDHWMECNKYCRSSTDQEYKVMFTQQEDGKYRGDVVLYAANENPSVIETVLATSPHKIKIALKASLERLGCEFEKETRGKDETIGD